MQKEMRTLCLLLLSVMLAVFLSCRKDTQADRTPAETPVTVDSVTSEDGLVVYFQVQGSGEKALVFVHGWSCDRSYWEAQTEEFGREYRVITVDLGGHGQSGLGRETWSISSFGADVAAVVEKLARMRWQRNLEDLKDAVLIGHSMGGAVIVEAACLLPDRVVALVGVDTYQSLEHTFTEEQADQFVAAFEADFVAATDRFVRGMFPPTADSALVEQVAADMSSAPPKVAISAMSEFLRHDCRSVLKEVRLPIRGINADMFPTDLEGNRRVAESFEVEIMPGYGHFLHMENPEAFNVHLHGILAEFWPDSLGS